MFVEKVRHHLRRYFLAGLLIVVPVFIAGWVTLFVYEQLSGLVSPMVRASFHLFKLGEAPEFLNTVLGVSILVCGFILIGFFTTNIIGKSLLRLWEGIIERIPLIRGIHNGAKQVLETLMSDATRKFKDVVLVEYPRRGMWAIGFVTNEFPKGYSNFDQPDLLAVFIPTTPNPTSGFLFLVPRTEALLLEISVDEGMKIILSGGLIAPKKNSKAPKPTESGTSA